MFVRDRRYRFILKDKSFYTGKIVDVTNDFVSMIDIKNNFVIISKYSIIVATLCN